MSSQRKILDTFQIIGFIFSTSVSIVLIFAGQDTVQSVILGLILATLTQLFDLQLRQSSSEDKILRANKLSRALYQDNWLLKFIEEIVDNYLAVKSGWYALFKRRADDVVVECHNTLHSLAEGYMNVGKGSGFAFGAHEIRNVEKCLKSSSVANMAYWRTPIAVKHFQETSQAIKRGVTITRIFILDSVEVNEYMDILEQWQKIGADVYIAAANELPVELNEDYLIADDCVYARLELTGDGRVRGQRISIDKTEIEHMIEKFNILRRHSRKLDDIRETLKV